MNDFTIKDSGARAEFDSGMVRDTEDGKVDFLNVLFGPMLRRWAEHLTKAKAKYPDVAPGVPNWTLGKGEEELQRYRRSLIRHTIQYLNGDMDEDHAAAIFFNVNGIEYVKEWRSMFESKMASYESMGHYAPSQVIELDPNGNPR